MEAIDIRLGLASEAAAIAAVHVRADHETYAPIFGDAFLARDPDASLIRWREALSDGGVVLVAAEGDNLVGFAHARGEWMSALYLLASHQRRGIGTRLLDGLCDALARRGVAELGFQAVAGNAAAIAFYEARGARAVGRVTQREGTEAWEEIVFRMPIAAPDFPAPPAAV